jgi:large subunit ribosomal protein L9
MDIILTQDVPKLGYKGDTLKVRPGYARNFLIPQGMAIIATKVNAKIMEENQRQASHKIAKVKQEAEELAAKLADTTIEMVAKTGTSGKIFGSITTLQVAQVLKEKGFDIDRRKITLSEEIKNVGAYTATLDLHKNVKATINLVVSPDNA